jgi:hypothetical protein
MEGQRINEMKAKEKRKRGQGGNHEDCRIAMTMEGLTKRVGRTTNPLCHPLVDVSCLTRLAS